MKVYLPNHFVFPYHAYGGTEKRVYFLAKHLRSHGVDARVISSRPSRETKTGLYQGIPYSFIEPQFTSLDTRFDGVSARTVSTFGNLALFSFYLAAFLQKQEFDILHTHLTDPYFYLRLPNHKPTVFQPWEEIHVRSNDSSATGVLANLQDSAFHIIKRRIDRFCIMHADAVASESELQTSIFVEQFNVEREKIFPLPVGVDTKYISGQIASQGPSRGDVGLSAGDFVLVSANRLDRMKGLGYLIEAVSILEKEIENIKLLLIGRGPEEGHLRAYAKSKKVENRVVFIRSVPEEQFYKVLALGDVYVSPGFHYISVTGLLDAMACGLPIVSTVKSFCVENGVNGYTVGKGSAAEIAEAVERIYDADRAKVFGRRSLDIAQKFDYDSIVDEAIRKYESLLEQRGCDASPRT